MSRGRLLTMPAMLGSGPTRRDRKGDPRYVEGQRILVQAIRHLVQSGPETNLPAIELLSEHFRTKFRMTDKPAVLHPQS